MSASSRLQPWLRRRIFKGIAAGRERTRLRYRRIYIVPTRNGMMFALMLLAMWLGAINYDNSMIYLLTFLLSSIAIVSIIHTFRNLIGLEVMPLDAEPVCVGQKARFPIQISNPGRRGRVAIGLRYRKQLQSLTDVPAGGSSILTLELPTERRGVLKADRCALVTIFPTGMFLAWSWLDLELSCLVYPAPEQGRVPPPAGVDGDGDGLGSQGGSGQEDFQGLREYRAGDSLRHIAWRRTGADGSLHTKQFAGESMSQRWLDWDSLPDLAFEARLARLCRWVLDADADGRRYGLRLPGVVIPLGSGPRQRRRCLEALATYGL